MPNPFSLCHHLTLGSTCDCLHLEFEMVSALATLQRCVMYNFILLRHLWHQLWLISFSLQLTFSYLQIHPMIFSPALTTLLSLYFSITTPCPTLLSLTNLPLPYCTVLQTTPSHLSALCYINRSYFVVVCQFVNRSQLPTIQAPLSAYSCDQLWLTLPLLTLTTFPLLTFYPLSEIKDTIQVQGCNT